MKKRDEGPQRKTKAPPPKGGLAGWFAQIKAKAAEIQRQADKK